MKFIHLKLKNPYNFIKLTKHNYQFVKDNLVTWNNWFPNFDKKNLPTWLGVNPNELKFLKQKQTQHNNQVKAYRWNNKFKKILND